MSKSDNPWMDNKWRHFGKCNIPRCRETRKSLCKKFTYASPKGIYRNCQKCKKETCRYHMYMFWEKQDDFGKYREVQFGQPTCLFCADIIWQQVIRGLDVIGGRLIK